MSKNDANDTAQNLIKRSPREGLTESELLLIPPVNPAYHLGELADEVSYDIVENKKVMLTGPHGSGKSSLFLELAARISQPVIRVNMNGQTTISDFVGFWTVIGGETKYTYGALPLAAKNGYWLLVDEIDFAEPAILSVLNPVAEKDGMLYLKEKGHEIIKPHPNFRLLATANTVGVMESHRHIYQGANLMNRALLDRFRIYHVDYLPAAQEIKVLLGTVPEIDEGAATALVKLANDVRLSFNNEEISCTFSMRQLIDFAELINRKRKINKKKGVAASREATNQMIIEAAGACIYSKVSKEDGEVIKGLIQRILDE